jgi:hypothetical protein
MSPEAQAQRQRPFARSVPGFFLFLKRSIEFDQLRQIASGIAHYISIWRDIVCYKGSRADDGIVPYFYAKHNRRIGADPHIVPDNRHPASVVFKTTHGVMWANDGNVRPRFGIIANYNRAHHNIVNPKPAIIADFNFTASRAPDIPYLQIRALTQVNTMCVPDRESKSAAKVS